MAFKTYWTNVVLSKLLYIGILAAVLEIKFTLGGEREKEGKRERDLSLPWMWPQVVTDLVHQSCCNRNTIK